MSYIDGIKQDEALFNIISERSDCYINDEGELCVYVPDAPAGTFDDVIDKLRESTTAFGGRFYGCEPRIVVVDKEAVSDAVQNIKMDSEATSQNNDTENTESLLQLKRLLEIAANQGISDIHLKLIEEKSITEVNKRVDGRFSKMMENQSIEYGKNIGSGATVTLGGKQEYAISAQIDVTFKMAVGIKRKGDNGSTIVINKSIKWRFSQIPLDDGAKITIRNLDTGSGKIPSLRELGLSKGHERAFKQVVNSAQGSLFMSGPTGSGKTTTINSALSTVDDTKVIHSLEDPVEFHRTGRNHFATNVVESYIDPKTKQRTKSFEVYGAVLLRHDSNGLYFGEIRTKGAAACYMRLASTGQVMLGTIHCNSAIATITTVAEQLGVPTSQLASPGILSALAHQRLVRTLCPKCKISHKDAPKYFVEDPTLEMAYKAVETIGEQQEKSVDSVYYRNDIGGMCSECEGTGEKGRTALFEIIMVDDKGREFIRELRLSEWKQYLESQGWPSIREHAELKLLAGILDYRSVAEEVDGLVKQDLKGLYQEMREI
ncbi:Type II secretion system protein E [Vibrio thalassae]|uniref:Type II secretion system protein E n=1 Tax=Vibrio thalassae TaxID=1243014 RepID=A0A240EGY7_9VIBR|nr:ATPase, T2SS/T4P/T4SS family [Vibrio thalassae]SNX47235.1 Type II secretion system protein E [Vibrio thalassae]